MLKNEEEKKLATYLATGTFIVTVFLLTSTNTDPVNVTKLFALGGLSIAVLAVAVVFGRKSLYSNFKPTLIVVAVFNSLSLFASIASRAPFSQNFFGVFGRNNGFLTYALFSGVMVSALLISKTISFEKIFYSLFAAGIVNIFYCAWVLIFGDFIPWNNPYGNILGFFGNPDFISAFLGMFIAGSLAFIATSKTRTIFRFILGFASLIALYEIIKSHAIQGLVVAAGGLAIVGFYALRSLIEKQIVAFGYALLVLILGFVAVMGTLQKGPFSFVYKRSVSLRGSYWDAGLEMGSSNPLTGVGLDTYGDWYRRARPPVALIDTPGIGVTSNVAHNVVIDFFASGGYPLLISYLAILAIGLVSIIRVTLRIKRYDRVFVGLVAVWLCYQVQSIISINQIGLAIWGWLFTGLLVAYEHSTRRELEEGDSFQRESKGARRVSNASVISPQLVAGIGLIVGLLITLPPLIADSKWYSATRSQNATKVESALAPSLFNPSDSSRYALAVNLFESSNLSELALKYTLIAVDFNPDYFEAWRQLYFLPNASESDKATALSNMKRLDPKNPDVTATQ
jgi:O-antigen ligase